MQVAYDMGTHVASKEGSIAYNMGMQVASKESIKVQNPKKLE